MRIFVITLNRYDCRWAKYNKNYELFMGVDGYKIKEDNEYFKKIRNRYNIKPKQKQNVVGCFLSHLKVMEYIVENKLNEILIIEDDAVVDFKLLNKINLDELQQDKMTYFGGIIRGLTLKKDFNYERVVEDIFEGINTIDTSKYKIGGNHGYYFPKWEVAEQVITYLKNKPVLKAIDGEFDLLQREGKLIDSFIFPAISYLNLAEAKKGFSAKYGIPRNMKYY